jgi:hypothetical protein
VNTGEALVCALTGVCVGDVVMASYDFMSTSSLCKERSTRRDRPNDSTTGMVDDADDGHEVVSASDGEATDVSDPRRASALAVARTHAPGGADVANTDMEKLYGECYRVVEKLFGKCEGVTDEWKDTVTLRCRDCHVLCVSALGNAAASKMKSDYACLAALYLIREGLVIKGTRVCEVEKTVAANIPSLNVMTKFGFQKSKYTKAYRTLMDAIDKAQYSVPLHELKI